MPPPLPGKFTPSDPSSPFSPAMPNMPVMDLTALMNPAMARPAAGVGEKVMGSPSSAIPMPNVVTPPRTPSVSPMAPIPPRPAELNYKPIPGSAFSGNLVFRRGIDQMFAAHPDDSVDVQAEKIRGKSEINKTTQGAKFDPITAEDSLRMVYETYAGVDPNPELTVSDEERNLMQMMGEVPDPRRMATAGDLDPNYRNFALGLGLASLLRGGSAAPGFQALQFGTARKQMDMDLDFQAQQMEAQARQAIAQAELQRIAQVRDANFQQQAYMARDRRTAINTALREAMTLDRQTQVEVARLFSTMSKEVADFIQTGDSERFKVLADAVFMTTGGKIDLREMQLPKGARERNIESLIAGREDLANYRDVLVELGFRKDGRDTQEMLRKFKQMDMADEKTRVEIETALANLRFLPQEKRAQIALDIANAEEARARARRLLAEKPDSPDAANWRAALGFSGQLVSSLASQIETDIKSAQDLESQANSLTITADGNKEQLARANDLRMRAQAIRDQAATKQQQLDQINAQTKAVLGVVTDWIPKK